MAAQGEPQVQFKVGNARELGTLTWSLSPCLLLPRQRWSWTQPWQHSTSTI
ncbi:hypothetical protein K5549_007269 [Capra hircus]|uniref:Uncharacterized protein n=1 Tax=Capra hircus TaxID=9925 RepID=A0A452FD45_CAPHI|nr:hypothetical protein K5549_007269 [Capra hircus]